MRHQNAGSHDGADEVFVNFASGGRQEDHDSPTAHPSSDTHGYEDPLDDVFGSAPSSPAPGINQNEDGFEFPSPPAAETRRDIQDPSDIPRLRSVHVTNGYREGLSASKEQHVQAGFDEGYSLGAELGLKVGWVLGVLEGCVMALPPRLSREGMARGGDVGVRDSGEGVGGTVGLGRESVRAELARAEKELSMRHLFGDEFFGSDGVWTYPVPGHEEGGSEENVTFERVAAAHPLVVRWERRVRELAERLGLKVG